MTARLGRRPRAAHLFRVRDNRAFNALLIKVYPFTALGMFFAGLVAYWIIAITGFGIS